MAHNNHGQLHAANTDDMDDNLQRSSSGKDVQPKESKREQLDLGSGGSQLNTGRSKYEDGETNELALRNELENVRKVNDAIEGLIESLDKAKNSMRSVNQTVNAASTLLNTWTRILSQTEHNQRLILNPTWQGASQDQADHEQEAYARRQAMERRELEEQERRAAVAKRADDEERKKADAATRNAKPSQRGRGRPVGRATSTTQSATPGSFSMGGQGTRGASRGSGAGARRTASGIGKGVASGRGRGTGA